MPSAVSPAPRANLGAPDELDRLLDYDNAVDDFLRDLPIGNNERSNQANEEQQPRDEDQEVQVKKKRNPVPKLDENRLLSQAGIPKLRKTVRTRLKFRGKGHEFSDISRLLNTYQLWLDDLYPRAKFRDALTMVEKVGHSKRMQVMRKAWLDDTKPHVQGHSPEAEISAPNGDHEMSDGDRELSGHRDEELFAEMLRNGPDHDKDTNDPDAPDGDELDDLLAESAAQHHRRGPFNEEEPDDDELDTLLAENQAGAYEKTLPHANAERRPRQPSEEDLALMPGQASEQNPEARSAAQSHSSTARRYPDDDFADEEEVLAGMNGMW